MNLFVADIHFGLDDPETERAVERNLIEFLRNVRPEVEALYLVGDVFEHYIEYRHSVPKGFARFQGLLAEWTDAGIPIVYFIGNHDLWHRDYFESELGVRVVRDGSIEQISGKRVFITHGDGIGPGSQPYSALKPILRHPLPVRLYTSLLPSDLGIGIAKWYSRKFRKTSANERRVAGQRKAARDLLSRNGTDIVVMGHSHHPEVTNLNEGLYINPGSWRLHRTVAIISGDESSIAFWNGSALEPYRVD